MSDTLYTEPDGTPVTQMDADAWDYAVEHSDWPTVPEPRTFDVHPAYVAALLMLAGVGAYGVGEALLTGIWHAAQWVLAR